MTVPTATGVVEQMLDHAAKRDGTASARFSRTTFVIVEPDSLPYGGSHHGVDGYVALMQRIASLFELRFELGLLHQLDDRTVLLQMDVTFIARQTTGQIRMPVVELLTLRASRIARSQVFLFDAGTLAELADAGRPPGGFMSAATSPEWPTPIRHRTPTGPRADLRVLFELFEDSTTAWY